MVIQIKKKSKTMKMVGSGDKWGKIKTKVGKAFGKVGKAVGRASKTVSAGITRKITGRNARTDALVRHFSGASTGVVLSRQGKRSNTGQIRVNRFDNDKMSKVNSIKLFKEMLDVKGVAYNGKKINHKKLSNRQILDIIKDARSKSSITFNNPMYGKSKFVNPNIDTTKTENSISNNIAAARHANSLNPVLAEARQRATYAMHQYNNQTNFNPFM